MKKYKDEVFLIKDRYYTFSSVYHIFPMVEYGAVEASLTIDMSDDLHFSDCFSDVLILQHGEKWGFFPRIACSGGSVDWASIDSQPFQYEDFRATIDYSGIGEADEFGLIFLKKDGRWGAIKAVDHIPSPVIIESFLPFEYDTFDSILEAASHKCGHRIDVKLVSDRIVDEAPAFDVKADFMSKFSLTDDTRSVLDVVLGMSGYELDKDILYAAAHHNPYALIIVGRKLYEEEKETREGWYSSDSAKVQCARSYLKLAVVAARSENNKTLEEIAEAMLYSLPSMTRFGKLKRIKTN